MTAGTPAPTFRDIPAISVRQPWAWGIVHAGKDIENRDWPTRFRGTVLLHASKWWNAGDIADDFHFIRITAERLCGRTIPGPVTLRTLREQTGGIVGVMEIVDCVDQSDSPWFFGRYGFVIRNARPLPFTPCKGALGFFKPALPCAISELLGETDGR